MQLSKRMTLLASMVTAGNRLADVGTDHGYIPIALVQEGKIPSAVAMDVNKGPLSRAEEHIHSCGLDAYIETRLSDGLEKLKPGEADTVLIAGMGGALTIRILNNGRHCLDTVRELILQPQSEIHLVREYLSRNHFRIEEEDIVYEDGKYYPVMHVVHGHGEPMNEAELYYGVIRKQRSPQVLENYLRAEIKKTEAILHMLREARKEASGRAQELRKKRTLMEYALTMLKNV